MRRVHGRVTSHRPRDAPSAPLDSARAMNIPQLDHTLAQRPRHLPRRSRQRAAKHARHRPHCVPLVELQQHQACAASWEEQSLRSAVGHPEHADIASYMMLRPTALSPKNRLKRRMNKRARALLCRTSTCARDRPEHARGETCLQRIKCLKASGGRAEMQTLEAEREFCLRWAVCRAHRCQAMGSRYTALEC